MSKNIHRFIYPLAAAFAISAGTYWFSHAQSPSLYAATATPTPPV